MTTALARQIITRAKTKNMSMTTLGREAGLKDHAIRNILIGKSKNPNAQTMQAIADVLECTVRDLLVDQGLFQEDDPAQSKEEFRNKPYQHPKLLIEVVNLVNEKIAHNKKPPTIHQVLTSIEEIYLHSVQKDPPNIDEGFAGWFMKLMGE